MKQAYAFKSDLSGISATSYSLEDLRDTITKQPMATASPQRAQEIQGGGLRDTQSEQSHNTHARRERWEAAANCWLLTGPHFTLARPLVGM